MFSLSEKYVRFHVRLMNFFARAFGVMALLVGIGFCVSAFIENRDRGMFAVMGVVISGIGVAFLVVRPLTVESIYAFAGVFGIRGPRDDAKKRGKHGA